MKIFGDEVHPNYQQVTTKHEEPTRPSARGILPEIEVTALFNQYILLVDISGSFFFVLVLLIVPNSEDSLLRRNKPLLAGLTVLLVIGGNEARPLLH